MAAATSPPFRNVQDAFCHRFRCAPEQFDRKVFFRTLHPFRSLLALPIWWFNRQIFAVDLDLVQSFGKSVSKAECSALLEEFYNSNKIERGFRRGSLKIRVSGTRIVQLRDELEPLIQPADPANLPAETTLRAGNSALASHGVSAVVLRKLRQIHAAITQGTPVAESLRDAGMTEDLLLEQLAANASGNPALVWLRELLLRERRLAQLEQQISGLNQALAAQSVELVELRSRRGGVS